MSTKILVRCSPDLPTDFPDLVENLTLVSINRVPNGTSDGCSAVLFQFVKDGQYYYAATTLKLLSLAANTMNLADIVENRPVTQEEITVTPFEEKDVH